MNNSNTAGSKFWMDEAMFTSRTSDNVRSKEKDDLMKMASVKRAIGNFVKIVTGESITVKYSTSDASATDGKTVVLSGDAVREKNFDAAVGLALHEGSHIKLSDFSMLKNLSSLIPTDVYEKAQLDYGRDYNRDRVIYNIKSILNWIEDRRIDYFIYTSAPGYRAYYKAMYNKYFDSPIIGKALQSKSYRKEDWDSYMFRLINLTNPRRDIKALKKLRAIFDIVDMGNISRFKNTMEIMPFALDVYRIIDEQAIATKKAEEAKKQKADEEKANKPKQNKNLLGYTAQFLPDGITLNKKTGALTGELQDTNEHLIVITAHYKSGVKNRKKLILCKK